MFSCCCCCKKEELHTPLPPPLKKKVDEDVRIEYKRLIDDAIARAPVHVTFFLRYDDEGARLQKMLDEKRNLGWVFQYITGTYNPPTAVYSVSRAVFDENLVDFANATFEEDLIQKTKAQMEIAFEEARKAAKVELALLMKYGSREVNWIILQRREREYRFLLDTLLLFCRPLVIKRLQQGRDALPIELVQKIKECLFIPV